MLDAPKLIDMYISEVKDAGVGNLVFTIESRAGITLNEDIVLELTIEGTLLVEKNSEGRSDPQDFGPIKRQYTLSSNQSKWQITIGYGSFGTGGVTTGYEIIYYSGEIIGDTYNDYQFFDMTGGRI